MKYLFPLFLALLSFNQPSLAKANSSLSYYAKVMTSGVYFYHSQNDAGKQFEIPQSYFVLLTGDASEEFYSAKYGNRIGFVKKNEVSPMDGSPKSPFATNFNFRITSMSGLPLFKEATFESEEVASLQFLEDDIYFYGNFQGQEFFENSTDIWYYCSYTKNNKTEFGYVFSYYCDFITPISQNNEYFEEIKEQLVFTPQTLQATTQSDTIKALIILAVVIPVLIGLYFFLSPKKAKTKDRPKRAKRRTDYYELSESDLN